MILRLITVRNGRMLECRPFRWDPTAVAVAVARACGSVVGLDDDSVTTPAF
ncbi:hypothetical protein [Nonomuraea sp. MG754425]|uniref:hypothetical protein n=1 Tax=Nonomuraea sp. MG754425 TaxID=2570319 RepID=UPI001F406CEB|nr:hypothetical protein [Nonomuraea sp. MG754425]